MCRDVWETGSPGNPQLTEVYTVDDAIEVGYSGTSVDHGANDLIHKPPTPPNFQASHSQRIGNLHRELARLANRDPLTRSLQSSGLFEEASKACLRAGEESPLSAIFPST